MSDGFVRVGRRDYRVLYVEDEDINWEVAEFGLGKHFQLTRARHAREAFALLRSGSWDAVLMDIQLAGSELDGIQITRILRGRFEGTIPDYAAGVALPALPIIFVTAYSARYRREELMAAGGEEMISKPVDFTHLRLALSNLLVRRADALADAK